MDAGELMTLMTLAINKLVGVGQVVVIDQTDITLSMVNPVTLKVHEDQKSGKYTLEVVPMTRAEIQEVNQAIERAEADAIAAIERGRMN